MRMKTIVKASALLLIFLVLAFLIPHPAQAQGVTVLAMCEPRCQFFNTNGSPLSIGKIFTYVSGTSTPLNSYGDNTGQTVNQNPLTLDGAGFGDVWLLSGNVYRIVAQDMNGVQQYVRDGIVGIGGGGGSGSANWSALLPGTNTNAGNFIVNGNNWDFSLANLFKAPVAAGISLTAIGSLGYDSSANKWQFFQNGAPIGFGVAGTGACPANQWVSTPGTVSTGPSCSQPAASNLSNGTTGSGAMVLATSPALTTPRIGGNIVPNAPEMVSTVGAQSFSALTNGANFTVTQFFLSFGHTLTRIYGTFDVTISGCSGSATIALFDFNSSATVGSINMGNGTAGATVDSGALSAAMTAGHAFGFNVTTTTSGCSAGAFSVSATYQ